MKLIALACIAAVAVAIPVTSVSNDKSIFALQLDGVSQKVTLSEADQKMGWYAVHKDSTLGQAGYRFWAPRSNGVDFKGEKKALGCNAQKSAAKGKKHVMQYVCNPVDLNTARFAQVKTKDFWNVCASASITAPPCQDDAAKYIAYALDSSGYYGCTKIGPNGYCTGDSAQYPITGSYFGGFSSGAPLDKDGGFDIVTGEPATTVTGTCSAQVTCASCILATVTGTVTKCTWLTSSTGVPSCQNSCPVGSKTCSNSQCAAAAN